MKIGFAVTLLQLAFVPVYAESLSGWFLGTGAAMTCNQDGPNGLLLDASFYHRFSLKRSEPFTDNAYLDFGADLPVTPADAALSFFARWQPFDFIEFAGRYGFSVMHNLFGYGVYRAPSPSVSPYSWTNSLSALENRTANPGGLSATLKFKLGPVIATSSLDLSWVGITGFRGYFLNRQTFLVQASNEMTLQSDSYLLFDPAEDGFLLVGLNYRHTWLEKSPRYYQRPAAIMLFRPKTGIFDELAVAVMGGWNLQLNELFVAYSVTGTLLLGKPEIPEKPDRAASGRL